MSDKFNKDDLPPWQQGGAQPDDGEPGDEEAFDWQSGGKPGEAQPQEGKLGFTGQLEWRHDTEPDDEAAPEKGEELPDWLKAAMPADAETPAAEEDFDWLTDETAGTPAQPGKLGFTGELPWLEQLGDKPQVETPVDRAEAELFGWIDAEADTLPLPPDEKKKLVSDWMQQGSDELPATPPAVQTDIPDWLTKIDAEEDDTVNAVEEDAFVVGGELSDDFLALGDQLPETAESELTYDEWLMQQQRIAQGPDLEEETPDDLLTGLEDASTALRGKGTTSDLPGWYLGLEELKEDDAPDWLNAMAETGGAGSAPADVPPWISGEESAIPPPPPPPPVQATFDDDFFASLGIDTVSEETPPPTELPDTGELLASLGINDMSWVDEEEVAAQPSRAKLPDTGELLASLGIEDETSLPSSVEEVPTTDFLNALIEETATAPTSTDEIDTGFLRGFLEGSDEPEQPQRQQADWLAAFEEREKESQPDWLSEITPEDVAQEQAAVAMLAEENELEALRSREAEEKPVTTGHLDAFLAGLGSDELPKTGELVSQPDVELDLDALFADPAFSDLELDVKAPANGGEAPAPAPDVPDFLRELQASVGALSAAALLRQRKDERGVNELPDRLQRLHLRANQLPVAPEPVIESGDISAILSDVRDALPLAPIRAGLIGIETTLLLSEEQKQQTSILNKLVSADRSANRLSAIEATYDTPYLPDLGEEEALPALAGETAAAERPQARRPGRSRYKIDRLVIALLLAAAMIAPFFLRQLHIGGLPPAAFSPNSPGAAAFARVDALGRGDLALIAIEYGATGAAELDGLTDMLVRHLLLRGARPVLVGGSPIGLLHAGNLIERINADTAFLAQANNSRPFLPNRDYYVVRYLAGSEIGLRAFSENTGAFLLNDIRGQATNLNVASLSDFDLIAVVAERGDDVRAYAEQLAPLAGQPVLIATSLAAAPLAEPYQRTAGFGGLLVGYRDTYTYAAMLGFIPLSAPPAVTEPVATTPAPSEIATEAVTAESAATTPAPSEIATEAVTEPVTAESVEATPASPEIATEAVTEPVETTPAASNTPAPTATAPPTPSETPAPTATTPPAASNTPAPTATATPAAAQILGVVSSNQRVNVRNGPGTTFGVVDSVAPGGAVLVIGRSADSSWYEVIVPETGTRGWMSAQLIRLEVENPVIPETTPLPLEGAFAPAKAGRLLRPPHDLPAQEPTPGSSSGLQGLLNNFLNQDEDSTAEPAAVSTAAAEAPVESATEDDPAAEDRATTEVPVQLLEIPAAARSGAALDMPYRDERWYAMTIGTAAAALIITFGTIVNIIRAIARRGKPRQ